MKPFRNYYKTIKLLTCLILLLSVDIMAQDFASTEIFLMDKNAFNPYVEFVSTDIKDFFNPEKESDYPSTNLFDGNLNTCWVVGSSKTATESIVYVKIPADIDIDKIILNIFNGYGKSKTLYAQNSRPKKIKLSVFSAFYPEGGSTEVVSLYIIKKIPVDKQIELKDTFSVQSFALDLDQKALLDFQEKALKECDTFSGETYKNLFGVDVPKSFTPSFILKIEIVDVYKGTKYDDICISEIFFNDRFIMPYPDKYAEILNVYVENENTLLMDDSINTGVVVYSDTSSVLQIIAVSENKQWAILISMPAEIQGRVETTYLLVNLVNRKIVNSQLEKTTDSYQYGNGIYFDNTDNNRLFLLMYNGKVGEFYRLELR